MRVLTSGHGQRVQECTEGRTFFVVTAILGIVMLLLAGLSITSAVVVMSL